MCPRGARCGSSRRSCFVKSNENRRLMRRTPMSNKSMWKILLVVFALAGFGNAQTVDQLTAHQVKLEAVSYEGKRAIKITEDGPVPNGRAYAIVKGADFHNGSIEVELAGRPAAGAFETARGYVGV